MSLQIPPQLIVDNSYSLAVIPNAEGLLSKQQQEIEDIRAQIEELKSQVEALKMRLEGDKIQCEKRANDAKKYRQEVIRDREQMIKEVEQDTCEYRKKFSLEVSRNMQFVRFLNLFKQLGLEVNPPIFKTSS